MQSTVHQTELLLFFTLLQLAVIVVAARLAGELAVRLSQSRAVGEIIAVARFVALPETPGTAEFAIVVGDAYQRQGLASGLMDRLAVAAVARGIERFRAVTLSENVAIRRLLARLAVGDVQTQVRGEVTEMEIGLTAREAFGDRLGAAA